MTWVLTLLGYRVPAFIPLSLLVLAGFLGMSATTWKARAVYHQKQASGLRGKVVSLTDQNAALGAQLAGTITAHNAEVDSLTAASRAAQAKADTAVVAARNATKQWEALYDAEVAHGPVVSILPCAQQFAEIEEANNQFARSAPNGQ